MNLGFVGVGLGALLAVGIVAWVTIGVLRMEGTIPAWWGVRRANRQALKRAGYRLRWATMAFDVHVRCPDCKEAIRMCMKLVERRGFNGLRIVDDKCTAVACLRCGYIEHGDIAEQGHPSQENQRVAIQCV